MKNGVRKISITPELKIEIPSVFAVTGVKELKVPSYRSYLEKDGSQFALKTLPIVARAASMKFHDPSLNKDITFRQVPMVAAADGRTQIPLVFVERWLDKQNHMGLVHADVNTLEDIGLMANQIRDKEEQRTNGSAAIASHT